MPNDLLCPVPIQLHKKQISDVNRISVCWTAHPWLISQPENQVTAELGLDDQKIHISLQTVIYPYIHNNIN